MKVSVKNQGKCEKILSIEVSPERVRSEFDKAYVEIAKSAKIPGFRPGKAPKEILQLHYGANAKETVLQNLVEATTREALTQEKIEPIYYPTVSKVDFEGEKLSYEAIIEIRPEVKLGSYKGLKGKKNEVKCDEKEVDESIERIRESFAKFIPVEGRGVEEGDYMICDIEHEIEGKKSEPRKDDWFEVDSKKAQKDLVEGVLGMKPEETRVIDVKFPKDFGVKDQAGKKAKFTVSLKEIKRKELPELNDEWVKELGEIKSIAELRDRIREDLVRQKEQAEEQRFESELLEGLLKQTKVEVSQASADRRLDSMVKEAKQRLKMQGQQLNDSEVNDKKLREKLKPEAEKQIKLRFIFEEIAHAENVKIEMEDIEAYYKKMADSSKVTVEQVKKYYEASTEQRENLINQLASEKILKILKDNAKA